MLSHCKHHRKLLARYSVTSPPGKGIAVQGDFEVLQRNTRGSDQNGFAMWECSTSALHYISKVFHLGISAHRRPSMCPLANAWFPVKRAQHGVHHLGWRIWRTTFDLLAGLGLQGVPWTSCVWRTVEKLRLQNCSEFRSGH